MLLQPLWNFIVETPLVRSSLFHLVSTTLETYLMYIFFLLFELGIVKAERLKICIGSPHTVDDIKEAWKMSLKNTLYLWSGMSLLTYCLTGDIHGGFTILGIPPNAWPEEAPSLFTFGWQLVVIVLCMDFMMYWLHRAYHWGPLYRYFHSVHHEFHNTIAAHSMCVHVVELFSIVPMLFLVPRLAYELFGLHPLSVYIAPYIMALHGVLEHCGYDDKLEEISKGVLTGSKMHMVHHQLSRFNFGFYTYFWDWLFDTCITYDTMLKRYCSRG